MELYPVMGQHGKKVACVLARRMRVCVCLRKDGRVCVCKGWVCLSLRKDGCACVCERMSELVFAKG
eukprot:1318039-Amorphochlora_amoeboformis.AAC.3